MIDKIEEISFTGYKEGARTDLEGLADLAAAAPAPAAPELLHVPLHETGPPPALPGADEERPT